MTVGFWLPAALWADGQKKRGHLCKGRTSWRPCRYSLICNEAPRAAITVAFQSLIVSFRAPVDCTGTAARARSYQINFRGESGE
jgi:hypothetical protein